MPGRCTRAPNLKLSICVYASTKNKQAKQKQQTFDGFFVVVARRYKFIGRVLGEKRKA